MNRILFATLLLLVYSLCACRKSNSQLPQGDTFFKTYYTSISNWEYTNTPQYTALGITTDAEGNLYSLYFDTCLSHAYPNVLGALNSVAILKADRHGNTLWNKRIGAFTPAWVSHTAYTLIQENFSCVGEKLYLAGQDPGGNFTILTYSTDGQYLGEIPLGGFAPAGSAFRRLYSMWSTKEGNLLLNFTLRLPASPHITVPYLLMIDGSGTLIWQSSDFPFTVADTLRDSSVLSHVVENTDGSFTFAGLGYNFSFSSPYVDVRASILNFYHVDKNGNLLFAHSDYGGYDLQISQQLDQPYKSPGVAGIPKIFTTTNGYLIAISQLYDATSDYDIKVFRADTAFNITDSLEIKQGVNARITSILQKSNGNLLFSNLLIQSSNVTYLGYLYEINPQLSVVAKKQVGIDNSGTTVAGITLTEGGNIAMTGITQPVNKDTVKLFILKMDNNEQY